MLRIVKVSFCELGDCLNAKGVSCDSTVREGKLRKEEMHIFWVYSLWCIEQFHMFVDWQKLRAGRYTNLFLHAFDSYQLSAIQEGKTALF